MYILKTNTFSCSVKRLPQMDFPSLRTCTRCLIFLMWSFVAICRRLHCHAAFNTAATALFCCCRDFSIMLSLNIFNMLHIPYLSGLSGLVIADALLQGQYNLYYAMACLLIDLVYLSRSMPFLWMVQEVLCIPYMPQCHSWYPLPWCSQVYILLLLL